MANGVDLVLLFDGIVEPVNPGGTGAWGYVLWIGTKKKIVGNGALKPAPWMTNNYAEFCALGFGLKKIIELNLESINSFTILGDSQLVVNQINGTWQVKSELLKPLHTKCLEYLSKIPCEWVMRWIPRAINEDADAQSREGYKSLHNEYPAERQKD